jgi:hypothetical protein
MTLAKASSIPGGEEGGREGGAEEGRGSCLPWEEGGGEGGREDGFRRVLRMASMAGIVMRPIPVPRKSIPRRVTDHTREEGGEEGGEGRGRRDGGGPRRRSPRASRKVPYVMRVEDATRRDKGPMTTPMRA